MITRANLLVVYAFIMMPLWVFGAFSRGTTFDFVTLEGKAAIECGSRRTIIDCRETFMEPWPYDVFVGPKVSRADNIELRVDSEGSTQVGVASYDGEKGRSSQFNLGVFSILSRPLLKSGKNNISYVIYNRNEDSIVQGKFVVHVGRLPTRNCPTREMPDTNAKDCSHTYSICQKYFKALNHCR